MKTNIKNRRDQNMFVYVDQPDGGVKGLAFVHHGFSGFADQPHIRLMSDCFLNKGYITVSFDGTHAFGESDGELVECTMDTHYHDLEDVIVWASTQEWYQEPFCLAGHSLGGFSNLIYATSYPEKIKAFAPAAACISYEHSEEVYLKNDPELWNKMKAGELKEKTSKSKPGAVGLVSFALYESFKNYDVLSKLDKITFPTLLIVGENDTSCPPDHQKIIFDGVLGEKEMYIIKGCGHTFREPEHLDQVKNIFNQWLENL